MQVIHLTPADLMADAEVEALRGEFLFAPHYDRVINDTATVLKPDGSPLLIYAKDALSRASCEAAFRGIKGLQIPKTDARGFAAGGSSFRRMRTDGTLSGTARWRPMRSAVVGSLDRAGRNPHCRMTSFTRDNPIAMQVVQPMTVEADQVFRRLAPERWNAQKAFVQRVAADYVIPNTVFTSVTVNRSERTAAHTDANDYRPGFGVMCVLEGGRYYGGELIFPKYRTAVDMRTGGVCLADVHEWHGNAPIVGRKFVRLAFIFYARERMHLCSSVEQERERAALLLGEVVA